MTWHAGHLHEKEVAPTSTVASNNLSGDLFIKLQAPVVLDIVSCINFSKNCGRFIACDAPKRCLIKTPSKLWPSSIKNLEDFLLSSLHRSN